MKKDSKAFVEICLYEVKQDKTQEFEEIIQMNGSNHIVIDLVRLFKDMSEGEYHGICW